MAVKKLKITTIMDNAVLHSGLLAEWGYSLFIETDQGNILFDCGLTAMPFQNNISAIGIDLNAVNKIVLSHGHNDHTGNLDFVLKSSNRAIDIIACPDMWGARFHKESWAGITHGFEYIKTLGGELTCSKESVQISADIITSGSIPMICDFEHLNDNLYMQKDNDLVKDDFADEQALIIHTEKGLVVISGCSHRGIVNILEHAKKLTGTEIHAVIGGSHLMDASEERIDKTVESFKKFNIDKIALSHCTGDKAASIFYHNFKDQFIFNKAGSIIDLI